MKKQPKTPVHALAELIGDFILYWGFRKIHGEIWTVVYLAEAPLSGVEISRLLQVSKALISPALKELEAEGLLHPTVSENSKTKRYVAVEDVGSVIRGVLKRREKPMLEKIGKSFTRVGSGKVGSQLKVERVQKLGQMIQKAQMALLFAVESKDLWD